MQFFLQNICLFRRKVIILHPIKQKLKNMSMLNGYFYGYYFYFASNCEAVGRK
jgi:hypothetical protein